MLRKVASFCNGNLIKNSSAQRSSFDSLRLINTTGVTSGVGNAYPCGAPEFTPVFSGVRVTRSLVLYVCFVDRCLSFCTFSIGHCVVCSSSIYGFRLPLWYLQTLLEVH